MDEHTHEEAFFDFLAAREAALAAAAGCLLLDNVPLERVRAIAEHASCDLVKLAARVVLHAREGAGRIPTTARPPEGCP